MASTPDISTGWPQDALPVGHLYSLISSQPIRGTVTSELPFDRNALPGEREDVLIAAAYFDEPAGAWRTVFGEVDWDRELVRIHVSHFTEFTVLGWLKEEFNELVNEAIRTFMALTDVPSPAPPSCTADAPSYVTWESSGDILLGCVEGSANELVVRVVNNRAYGQLLWAPGGSVSVQRTLAPRS